MKGIKESFLNGLGFMLAVAVVAIFVIAARSFCPAFHYRNAYLPRKDIPISLDKNESRTLNGLVSKGVVISASDLYNDTISFYSALITYLIGILGLSGLFGYIYVRGSARRDAEEEAERAV